MNMSLSSCLVLIIQTYIFLYRICPYFTFFPYFFPFKWRSFSMNIAFSCKKTSNSSHHTWTHMKKNGKSSRSKLWNTIDLHKTTTSSQKKDTLFTSHRQHAIRVHLHLLAIKWMMCVCVLFNWPLFYCNAISQCCVVYVRFRVCLFFKKHAKE